MVKSKVAKKSDESDKQSMSTNYMRLKWTMIIFSPGMKIASPHVGTCRRALSPVKYFIIGLRA